VQFAAVPTLVFKVGISASTPEPIRALSLHVQVRIAAAQRAYAATEQTHLLDLFGEPSRWGQTLKSLLWSTLDVSVRGFTGQTVADVLMPCTYDFEVIATKYLDALRTAHIPLEFLFSGTLFYAAPDGRLQAEQISWDNEARFALPVRVWQDLMQRYFPNQAWVRLHKDTFDRLREYRMRHTLPSWEATVDHLLEAQEPAWTP
jgi:hypothetical protein